MMMHGFRKSRRRLSLKKPKLDTLQRLAYTIGCMVRVSFVPAEHAQPKGKPALR